VLEDPLAREARARGSVTRRPRALARFFGVASFGVRGAPSPIRGPSLLGIFFTFATAVALAAAATGTVREIVVGPLELVVAVRAQIVPEPAEVLRRGGGIAAWKIWKKLKPEEEVGPEVVLLVLLVLLVLEVDHVLGLGGQALVRFVDALERLSRLLLVPDVLVCEAIGSGLWRMRDGSDLNLSWSQKENTAGEAGTHRGGASAPRIETPW
jgi:hypothetical protein